MIKTYSLSESVLWDELVKSFKNYDVYYLSGYTKAFKIHGDGEPLLVYAETDTARAINVVMKRDIAKDKNFTGKIQENTYFDFATPYGYGGWLFEGEDVGSIMSEYENYCGQNNIVSEFVRYHPVLKNQMGFENFYNVIPLGLTIALDLESDEVIWQNISSKNRNMIRKAEKSGITIHRGSTEELYQTFREIYNGTMDKDNATDYYYFGQEFYKSVQYDLPDNSCVFYALLDGKIIAASIILHANNRLNYHLSGSVREYQNLAPTNLLLYKAALWGSEMGLSTFHLGGGVGSGEDGLYKFKKSFYRKDGYQYYIGKKVFMKDKYDELVAMRNFQTESGFFPQYRT